MSELIPIFVFFFAVIDPIGTVPVFIAVTRGYEEADKRKIAIKAVFVSAMILLFFVIAGEPILNAMGIELSAFRVAGGIVLFLFALTMIFGDSKPEEEMKMVRKASETAIYPLAVPSIAGPGSMLAAVLMTENARFDIPEQAVTTAVMFAVLSVTLVLLLGATFVHRLIGDSGASIISRVMGLILASVAVSAVLGGIKAYFEL